MVSRVRYLVRYMIDVVGSSVVCACWHFSLGWAERGWVQLWRDYGPSFIEFSDRSTLQLVVFIGSLGPLFLEYLAHLDEYSQASIPAFVPKSVASW